MCFIEREGGLRGSLYVTLEEKVAIFLKILGHHTKQRVVETDFNRSGHTISKYFREVLQCVLSLHEILLAKPVPIPATCEEEPWCHFKVTIVFTNVISEYCQLQSLLFIC